MTDNEIYSAWKLTREARRAWGKEQRESVPRQFHADWRPPVNRASPLEILAQSNSSRLPFLAPIRNGRMLRSPFSLFRGLAALMAHDLQAVVRTNIVLQICGDAHLQNFGWFATPERNLIFDITDFDETISAPWEWDLKRLVVSVVLAARGAHASRSHQSELAEAVSRAYRDHLTEYEELSPLAMWYQRIDSDTLLRVAANSDIRSRYEQTIQKASERTIERLLPRLTHQVEGTWQFVDQPPILFHAPPEEHFIEEMGSVLSHYRTTLAEDRQILLDRYQLVDAAYKVVGVGSVGLRCGMMLLLDIDNAPLVLQVKEAGKSVWESVLGPNVSSQHQGQRIVIAQRRMQAASDLFLGWSRDSAKRDYYIRQLRDMKLSIDVERLARIELQDYAELCGWALARAHAKAGDATAILAYFGTGDPLITALAEFAAIYADQVERDYETLATIAKAGGIPVEPNV